MNGIDCFVAGFRLIGKPGLRQYVIMPLLINIVVLAGVVAYGVAQYDAWMAYLTGSLPDWLSFLSWLVGVLSIIVGIAVLLFGFTIVANIISSPFNAILSVKVEEELLGRSLESDTPFALILVRSLAREFAKLIYYLPRLLALVIISLIPGVNVIAPVLWILFGAWMMTVQYADYGADNNEVAFSILRQRLSSKRIESLMFGIIVYILVTIPVLNLLIIPAAVAGGTVFWVEHLRNGVKA